MLATTLIDAADIQKVFENQFRTLSDIFNLMSFPIRLESGKVEKIENMTIIHSIGKKLLVVVYHVFIFSK